MYPTSKLPMPTSSTKHTKDNRKCVVVTYYTNDATFKIPDGLDLEDKSVVRRWYVIDDTLHIYYTDGREEEIDVYEPSEISGEHDERIEDAAEYGVAYTSDEDEDEDEDDEEEEGK